MTLGKLALITSVAALLGAASPALADETPSGLSGPNDDTGMSTLGVDITGVGGGSDSVRDFLAQLSPDAQRGVLGGCRTAVNWGSGYSPAVIGFCQTALNIAPSGPAYGFLAEPNRGYVPSPIIENRQTIPDQTVPLGEVPPTEFESVDH